MALKCPTCGAVNPDNARFCWNDGEKLVTTGFQPFRPWYRIGWLRSTVAFVLIAGLGALPFIIMYLWGTFLGRGHEFLEGLLFSHLLPRWENLVGLGLAILITRTPMPGWWFYWTAFLWMPVIGIVIDFSFGIILCALIAAIRGTSMEDSWGITLYGFIAVWSILFLVVFWETAET